MAIGKGAKGEFRLADKKDFTFIMAQGLMLLHMESASQGLQAEAEEIVDALWHSIPTKLKKRTKVPGNEDDEDLLCIGRYATAKEIMPPKECSDEERAIARSERVLAKEQVLVDTLFENNCLFGIEMSFTQEMSEGALARAFPENRK